MFFVNLLFLVPSVLLILWTPTGYGTTYSTVFTVCINHFASCRVKELWNTLNVFYCYFYCGRNAWCRALTIEPVTDGVQCSFHEGIFNVTCNSFPVIENRDYGLLIKTEPYVVADEDCKHGLCKDEYCECTEGFTGTTCERYVQDCKEANDTGVHLNTNENTHVMVQPKSTDLAFEAQCNHWGQIVILARDNKGNDVLFNKSWEEYKHPFGIYGNFWLGLEHIYAMVNQGNAYKLQIYCTDFETEFSVFYATFSIQSESDLYQMTTGSENIKESDGFGGNKTNVPFCTYDNQCHDYPSTSNPNGGWWYVSGLQHYALTNPKSLMFKHNFKDFSVHQVSMQLEKIIV